MRSRRKGIFLLGWALCILFALCACQPPQAVQSPAATASTQQPATNAPSATPSATPEANALTRSPDGKGYVYEQDGWVYLHIEGAPQERGYQHGYLLANVIEQNLEAVKGVTYLNTGVQDWSYFAKNAEQLWADKLGEEFTAELQGIVKGAGDAGVSISFGDLLALNGNDELLYNWWPTVAADYYNALPIQNVGQSAVQASLAPQGETQDAQQSAAQASPAPQATAGTTVQTPGNDDHCSAFIATGSYTADGGIVVAHNSFAPYESVNYMNYVIDVQPQQGKHFMMQSQPGFIDSYSDYYSNGSLVITETTIGGFNVYDPAGTPEFVRSRKAAQYAGTLDEFVEIMLDGNNGGYANTWLVGDLETNEIMRFELGLKFYAVDKTKDGAYAGYNAPLDPRIQNFETTNSGFADIRRHQGARQVRIPALLEQYKGQIDESVAKTIIADHYDVYLEKDNPCSRTVCAHYELDAREYMSQSDRPLPYQPKGAVDGVVASGASAKEYTLCGRWGSSCGTAFSASEFLQKHPQFSYLQEYLMDRPSQPWTILGR